MTHRIPRSVRLVAIVFLLFRIDQRLSLEAQSADDMCVASTPSGLVRGVVRGTDQVAAVYVRSRAEWRLCDSQFNGVVPFQLRGFIR